MGYNFTFIAIFFEEIPFFSEEMYIYGCFFRRNTPFLRSKVNLYLNSPKKYQCVVLVGRCLMKK